MSELDDVFDLAANELRFRLEDNQRRSEIPDHVLIKFLDTILKREEQKRKDAELAADEATVDVLELLDKSRLPAARKTEMLAVEIKHTTERLSLLVAAADKLKEEQDEQ